MVLCQLTIGAFAGATSTTVMAAMRRWMRMGTMELAHTLKSRAWQADQAVEARGEPRNITSEHLQPSAAEAGISEIASLTLQSLGCVELSM